jgi:hypothetical protein
MLRGQGAIRPLPCPPPMRIATQLILHPIRNLGCPGKALPSILYSRRSLCAGKNKIQSQTAVLTTYLNNFYSAKSYMKYLNILKNSKSIMVKKMYIVKVMYRMKIAEGLTKDTIWDTVQSF